MKRYKLIGLWLVGLGLTLGACTTRDEFDANPFTNYDALWSILDTRYSYFDIKLPPDSSWRDMYYKHRVKLRHGMTTDSLFLVMTQLMSELRDGHVNLTTPFDYGRYWSWYLDYPSNYNSAIASAYLGNDYRIAGGLRYTQIHYNGHASDSIGYLRFASFSSSLSATNLRAAMSRLSKCKALIIDIRDNGGGNVTTSELFARHFINQPRMVGYVRHKIGPGHQDFSKMVPLMLEPMASGLRWLRPVVVLTNRSVYSAANDFVLRMKDSPFVTIIGDRTGGGGGLPMTSELPNGWVVRYSSSQTFDVDRQHIEHGIDPHYKVGQKDVDTQARRDTLIEYAIKYLKERLADYKRTKKWTK